MCDRRPRFLQAKQETGHHRIRRGGSQPLISPEAKTQSVGGSETTFFV